MGPVDSSSNEMCKNNLRFATKICHTKDLEHKSCKKFTIDLASQM